MAKLAIAGGHSKLAPGASGYINEYTEDRKVTKALIAELKKRGHTCVDCSNEKSTQNAELAEEVYKANKSKAKLFCANHFNAFTSTTGKRGVEVWYYSGDALGKKIATKMSKDLANLFGLPNRGAKATTSLYVLANTNMTAILPEICFCDAKGDADAYKRVTTAKIASVMATAIEYGIGAIKKTVKKPAATTPYKVKVIKDCKIRTGAGTSYKAVGSIKKGNTQYTIVEERKASNGVKWGKLKSGAGWITLSTLYVKKV